MKIKEIKEILHKPIINRDEKIEEISKFLYDPRNDLFKPEDHYKPLRIGNSFSSNYIEYKINKDKAKTLLIKVYLKEIKPYLNDIINYQKTEGEWKIYLAVLIKFRFSKDSEETRNMYSKNDNIGWVMKHKIIEALCYSFLQRYHKKN